MKNQNDKPIFAIAIEKALGQKGIHLTIESVNSDATRIVAVGDAMEHAHLIQSTDWHMAESFPRVWREHNNTMIQASYYKDSPKTIA